MYERHEDNCDDEDCECQQPPKEGQCIYCRGRCDLDKDFCSDSCGARWAMDNGATFEEERQFDG